MRKLTRAASAVTVLVLMVVVGLWSAWAMYDLASIYADPHGPSLEMLSQFGIVAVVGLLLLVGLACAATALAWGRLRRPVGLSTAGLVLLAGVGIVVGNELGVTAKRAESAVPPACGIGNRALADAFTALEHPGYFGGGEQTTTSCSYLLDTEDTRAALADYEKNLRDGGWSVSATADRLNAERGGYRFTAVAEEPVPGDPFLTVGMAER